MRPLAVVLTLALSTIACGSRPAGPGFGAPAPDFALPGADGRTHSLGDSPAAALLAVVFTCNTCPASQLYEARIQKLHDDYRGKGVAVVAINPNRPAALQLADLGYTDVGESLERHEGARRAPPPRRIRTCRTARRRRSTRQFGVVATPQIFVFDQARTLRYQGRIDDNAREDRVKSQRRARTRSMRCSAGRAVPVAQTPRGRAAR